MSAANTHNGDIPAGATMADLTARINVLEAWPQSYADAIDNDPRCGCNGPDGCDWDDVEALEAALYHPLALVAA